MDYTQGKLGRVFVARIDHEEDLLFELEDLAVNENIRSAFFYLLGATQLWEPKKQPMPFD
jgi:predicted DNA-binding protein with PD1-like motif